MSQPATKILVLKLRFPEFRDAAEWEENTFGGAATFINGKAYKQKELLDKGKYRVLRVGNFFSNKEWYYSDLELEENKYCDDGDLLYAWSASFGPRIWRGEKVIYHYHIWKVLENEGIKRDFLFILLDYETERMKSQTANGLGLLHITKGAIEGWQCYIPSPKEQQKIADCLSSIDELITAHSQKHKALKAHKKGLMQQLFPTEGETIPELRISGCGGWKEKSLGAIGEFTGGGTPSKSNESYWNGTIPWVSSSDISEDSIHQISITRFITKEAVKESATKLVPQNSILLVSRVGVGKLAISTAPICTSQDFTSFTPTPAEDNLMYLAYYLKSHKEVFYSFNQGMAIKGFTKNDIVTLKVSLPLDPKEQQKIADCLSSIDDLIAAQAKKIESLKVHKKGLMQQLFPPADEVNG